MVILIPKFAVTGEEWKRAQGSIKASLGSFIINLSLLTGAIYFFHEKDANKQKKLNKQKEHIVIMKKKKNTCIKLQRCSSSNFEHTNLLGTSSNKADPVPSPKLC